MASSIPSTPSGSRRVAFARQQSTLSKGSKKSNGSTVRSSVVSQKNRYGRRASVFIVENLSSVKNAGLGIGEKINVWLYSKIRLLSKKWFTHLFLIVVMILYTVGGALIFLTVEGQNETELIERDIKLDVRDLLYDFRKKSLTVPEKRTREEWYGDAARILSEFKDRIRKSYGRHPLVVSHTDKRVWTIWNAVVYCSTLYTTIGYGHLYPTTFTGRVLTIAYSTIGIPLFLIALTDIGKLFTRGIKFGWAHIRRFYYNKSCRRVRKTTHVQEIIKGAQTMYEYASFRRLSHWADPDQVHTVQSDPETPVAQSVIISEPQTPAISSFEVDDEFNLPISLALTILVAYILIGAAVFMYWESWDFFPAFYFVFSSMSTIGFGDIVPEKPTLMIVSIVYLCFGLALMTMCINVVQDKLSETFSHASAKIGETIGINDDDDVEAVDDDDGDVKDDSGDVAEDGEVLTSRIEPSPFVWSTAVVS